MEPPSTSLAVVVADAPSADLHTYAALMREADLRVAADGGARHFLQLDILPHLAIGDFDSLPAAMLQHLEQQGVLIESPSCP